MEPLPTETRSERLLLRMWQPDQAAALNTAVHESSDHLRPWIPWISFEPLTADDRRNLITGWIKEHQEGGDVVFGVFDDTGTTVGGAGLHRRAGPETLEIGYWIHVDHCGKGYATELSQALTALAFTVDGIDRVNIHVDKANEFSNRIPARLGYERGPETPDEIKAPGESGIDCGWFVTKSAWAAL